MPGHKLSHKEPKETPHLVRFLVKNAALGFTMAAVFVAAMLYFDIGNLTTLVVGTDVGIFAVVLLTFMIGLTFASLQMGYAVMFGYDDMDKKPNAVDDPLMSAQDMQRLGLQPIPVKNRRR